MRTLTLSAERPAALMATMTEWWDGLRPTTERAACPLCGLGGLEVRTAHTPSGVYRYVCHCGDVRNLITPAVAHA